jgi:hypothetical protein
LLQHVNNPVAWYPWCSQALNLAKKQNKPILLSIGYSACHWCHVMAHESFEDSETAKIMNASFINIKVDREERPDIDKVYQYMHQALTKQSGGWPLTIFLDPSNQMPFFSGTYFPKEKHEGRPSFKEILNIITDFYVNKYEDIADLNKKLQQAIKALEKKKETFAHKIKKTPLMIAKQNWLKEFDKENGGFTGAPKFAMPASLAAILYIATSNPQQDATDKEIIQLDLLSLEKISMSGLVDHIDGGFFRYCVDDKWQIPHFEKMLYDNAQMISLYAQGYALSKNIQFKETIKNCVDWARLDMHSFEGGFYSSLDADSEGIEGKFYTWDKKEIQKLLDEKEYALFSRIFAIDEAPNFEKEWHLVQKQSHALSSENKTAFTSIKQKLKTERALRIRPTLDDKILCSWNALMFKGLSVAGAVFNDPTYSHLATKTFNFIKSYLLFENQLWVSYNKGKRKQAGFLDDYAFLLDACWYYLQINYNKNDLLFAKWLCDIVLEYFWDNDHGFYFTSTHHEALIYRPQNWLDDVLPNGAALSALALSRFGVLFNDNKYIEVATRVLQLTQPLLDDHAQYYPTLLNLQAEHLQGLSTVIIYGQKEIIEKARLMLLEHYRLDRFVFAISHQKDIPDCFKQYISEDELSIYICQNKVCGAPLKSIEQLEAYLK